MTDLNDRIKLILSRRKKMSLPPDGLRRAAILVPLLERAGSPHIIFTKRTDKVAHHKGEISFPGGMQDEADRSLLETALRECHEEVGISPEKVEILGELDDTVTFVSQFHITAFVGMVTPPEAYDTNPDEIERVIEIPLSFLQEPSHQSVEYWGEGEDRRPIYFFTHNTDVIWGATARILKIFLEVLSGAPVLHR